MTKVIVSRVPDFVGHDGRVYNAVYGTFITDVGGYIIVGSVRKVNVYIHKELVSVRTDEFPVELNFTPYYNGNPNQYIRLYNADA